MGNSRHSLNKVSPVPKRPSVQVPKVAYSGTQGTQALGHLDTQDTWGTLISRLNLEQNICRLFHVFVQFLLTKSEMELD